MKKILSILLAVTMIVGLVPTLLVGVSAASYGTGDLTGIDSDKNGRVYHYYESFDTENAVQGAAKVMETLGWQLPDNATLVNNHNANVQATELGANGVPMYEIKGGRLYLRNHGTADESVLLCTAEELTDVLGGAYTVEYTLTYLPTTYNTSDGYFSLVFNATEDLSAYGEAVIRISGYGNNRTNVGALDAGDVSGSLTAETSMTSYRVNNKNNLTLYERLCGDVKVVPGTGNATDLRGTQLLANMQLRVRLAFDGVTGPRVYVNDVLVSDPRNINSATAANTAATNYGKLLAADGSALGFRLSAGMECVIDEIVLYDGISETGALSDLYITEIATLPENANAPYIEVYNAGTESVSLADYVLGYAFTNNDGGTSLATVALADYLGKSLQVGADAVIDNVSEAVLAAGQSAVIFPVNTAADVSALVNTVGANNLAGFRSEYALSADLIVAVPFGDATWTDADGNEHVLSNRLTVGATEHRVWFVGDRADEKGKSIDWAVADAGKLTASAYVESAVALTPSVAFGYDVGISDTSYTVGNELDPIQYNFGRSGDVMSGYAAHFVYGADASATANVGLMVSRSFVKIKDEMNMGKLLDVQASYFERIADYRAGRYDISGALSITEMIPVTDSKDAFECFELTNLGATAVNLYEYGLVSSGNALYGSLTEWTRGTLLSLNPVEGVVNPTNVEGAYLLDPGMSVVIWNMTVTGYTVDDFRAYHGLSDDVAVIAAASFDAAKNVVAANKGTTTYGVATAADISALHSGSVACVTEAVSDVIVPLHSLYYEIEGSHEYTWAELSVYNPTILGAMAAEELSGCLMNGVRVGAGKSLVGYYKQVEVKAPALTLADGTLITDYTYTTYKPCLRDEIADGETVYYAPNSVEEFHAYGTKQNINLPADYAVSFGYGLTTMASKSGGALMSSMTVDSYSYNMGGRGYAGMLPYLIGSANAFVTTEVSGGATAENTLGTVADAQGISTTIRYDESYYDVVYLDESGEFLSLISFNGNTCRDVYVVLADTAESWTVNGQLYAAGETVIIAEDTVIAPAAAALAAEEASIRVFGENGAGLRITTGVSKALYDSLVAEYGVENVTLKTAIVPTALVSEAGAATVEALNAKGYSYTTVKAEAFANQSYNTYYFAGSMGQIADVDCAYTGIGYIEVNANGSTARYYGATTATASVREVAQHALTDVSSVRSAVYCNEVAVGVYSPYTADQLQAIRAIG
ncbi:MAG: hypothetical protein IJY22_08555 [Clostridia bacterium]|nr:hypothetical protein [Clostridia bacterium]